ncbi:MAG: hypothetical protein P8012_12300 [Desulfobacterales bacterium]
MKKLQLFIIISSVLLSSYAFGSDSLITDDINNFCVDFNYSRQSTTRAAKHHSPDKTFRFSKFFSYPYISTDIDITNVLSDTDIDIPDASEMSDHEVTLMSSALKESLISMVRCQAAALFCFPSEAYRLRI